MINAFEVTYFHKGNQEWVRVPGWFADGSTGYPKFDHSWKWWTEEEFNNL